MQENLLVLMLAGVVSLSACGGGASGADAPAPPSVPGSRTLSGVVHGGQSSVSGSTVTLYAVGSSDTATRLDSAITDSSGRFSITGYGCPVDDPPVYLVASGGNPGLVAGTDNGALHLVTALGACSMTPASINVNELTTVAAAYALSAFINSSNTDDIEASVSNATGLSNAMAMAAQLVDAGNGALGSMLIGAASGCGGSVLADCDAAQRLGTLANALAACVNTASGSSPQCVQLFDCATPGATYNGNHDCIAGAPTGIPVDTLQAALAVARNPGTVSAQGIYDVANGSAISAFAPTLSAAPNAWILVLNFTGTGVSEPTGLALDAAGNVWIANYNDRVVKLSPVGEPLSGAAGFTGGGLHFSFGIVIDASGNVWVADSESTGGFNSNHGAITKLDGSGHMLSGAHGYAGGGLDFPQALAIDATGNVWAVNGGNASVTKLSSAGIALSPATGYTGGGVSYPLGLAFDPVGNLWIANQAANEISELEPSGMPISPTGGYTGGGLKVPQDVAVDTHGNVWVTNAYGNSVTELDSSGVPISSTAGYTGGGLSSPGGIDLDGAGRVWVANFHGASLSELAGADDITPGVPMSPATGFTAGNYSQPYAPVIDASGNVWVTNFGNDTVSVLVGAAAPVKMPRIGVATVP